MLELIGIFSVVSFLRNYGNNIKMRRHSKYLCYLSQRAKHFDT